MKRISIVMLSALVLVLAFVLSSHRTGSVQKKIVKRQTYDAGSTTFSRPTFSRFRTEIKTERLSGFSFKCTEIVSTLPRMLTEEMRDQFRTMGDLRLFFSPKCLEAIKENKLLSNFARSMNCPLFESRDDHPLAPTCPMLLDQIKAMLISASTQDTPLEHLRDEELAAHIKNMFFTLDPKDKPKTITENLLKAEELRKRYPEDDNVLEAFVGYSAFAEKVTGIKNHTKLDLLRSGDSFKRDRLGFIQAAITEKSNEMQENLEYLKERYPNEPELHYYQAAYAWRTGRPETAKQALSKAISFKGPCNYCTPGLYKDVYRKLDSTKKNDPNLFPVSIGLRLDQL